MLPDPAGIDSVTSWSPVGRAADLATEVGYLQMPCNTLYSIATATRTQIWQCCKKFKDHPRIIIWANLVDLGSPMLHTKIQPQRFLQLSWCWRGRVLSVFYYQIWAWQPRSFEQTVNNPSTEGAMWNLVEIGQVVFDLIVLGFNDTSTLVGHFVSSPREREKRDRRDSRRDEREGQGRKRKRNESEEPEEIKTSPPYPYLLQG